MKLLLTLRRVAGAVLDTGKKTSHDLDPDFNRALISLSLFFRPN